MSFLPAPPQGARRAADGEDPHRRPREVQRGPQAHPRDEEVGRVHDHGASPGWLLCCRADRAIRASLAESWNEGGAIGFQGQRHFSRHGKVSLVFVFAFFSMSETNLISNAKHRPKHLSAVRSVLGS